MPLINSSLGAWCQIVHTSLPIVYLCSWRQIVPFVILVQNCLFPAVVAKLSLLDVGAKLSVFDVDAKLSVFTKLTFFIWRQICRLSCKLSRHLIVRLHIFCPTLIHNSILNIQTILFASKYGRIDAEGWFQDQTQTKFILHICGSSICWAWGAITKADKIVCLMFSLCLLSPRCTGNLTKNFKWLSPIQFQTTISDYISLWINNG